MRIAFKAHPAGLAACGAALLFLPSSRVLAALAALALHESCHLLAMALCGVKRVRLELTPFGGVADVPGFHALSWGKQLLIALAGVAGSAAAAFFCLGLSGRSAFWMGFCNANIVLAFFNCLPFWPLDGARVVMAAARRLGWERGAAKGMLWLSYGASFALLFIGIYGAWRGHVNPSLFLLAPYLAYAAYESAICQRIRGLGDVLETGGGWKPGESKPVKAFACVGMPLPVQLAGMLRSADARHSLILHILDPKDGGIAKTVTQREMARELMDESP